MTRTRRPASRARIAQIADQRTLGTLTEPLVVTVHLAPEDPRFQDLRQNVLAKLERVMSNVSIRLASGRPSFGSQTADDAYGQIELAYGSRSDTTRSTSPREILPMLYGLAGVEPPVSLPGAEYPGYPLIVDERAASAWYFGGLPLLILFAWWWSRRPP